ncbi:uncharacterized protein G2W53_011927 [Senna tora]|uniref:Uncharacterized protein n=1 Tax=Senna tora TaxID=362788 RepID=A0A834WSG8_9FABA|nr:uncharacterized protein G2W53_011927 [Senna tora]
MAMPDNLKVDAFQFSIILSCNQILIKPLHQLWSNEKVNRQCPVVIYVPHLICAVRKKMLAPLVRRKSV